jgi:hypothetical protein
VGDVYAPHDLSSVEMGKFKGKFGGGGKGIGGGRGREWGDVCDVLGVEPVGEYKVRLLFLFLVGWVKCVSGHREGK